MILIDSSSSLPVEDQPSHSILYVHNPGWTKVQSAL
jgi:hypothetical protein